MKLVSKETLVLGGLYYVADTPFTLMGAEFITDILLLAFVGCCVMLCFNKTPKFLSAFTAKFPTCHTISPPSAGCLSLCGLPLC